MQESSNGRLIAMKCDLRNQDNITSLFESIRADCGVLHICVNAAGLIKNAPLLSGDTDDWKEMLEVRTDNWLLRIRVPLLITLPYRSVVSCARLTTRPCHLLDLQLLSTLVGNTRFIFLVRSVIQIVLGRPWDRMPYVSFCCSCDVMSYKMS